MTTEDVGSVLSMMDDKKSYREISSRLKVSLGYISKIRKKHRPKLQMNKGGRKRKLTQRNRRWVVQKIIRGQIRSARKAHKMIESSLGVSVCQTTVRNALRDSGLRARKKAKKQKNQLEK